MSIQKNDVFDYLDIHPVSRYEGDFSSLLEMLRYIYTTCNPIDSRNIREQFHTISNVLSVLPLKDQDIIFSCVCDLCYEYEQKAFCHGLTAGMHLMTEINKLP